jgi:hypothetical protein
MERDHMQNTNINMQRAIAIIAMLVIFIGLLAASQHMQRPDNGDGWRILRSAQIAASPEAFKHQPFPRFFAFRDIHRIRPVELVPMSSSAAAVETISFIERAAGTQQFDFMWVTAFYLALYLLGILMIVLSTRLIFAVPLLLILANPYILAYFNSPYEESFFLSLCPLMAFFFARMQSNGLAGRVIALAMASTKIQFVPAFLFGIRGWKFKSNALYLLLSFVLIGAVAFKASKFNEPNSYNRYYNGLAFSIAHVSTWPAKDFTARRASAGEMVTTANVVFPVQAPQAKQYWGTSFWPTGDQLEANEQAFVLRHVGLWFWQTVRANPRYILLLFTEPILTMIKADYRLDYIFAADLDYRWLAPYAWIMQHFGMIFLLASLCSLVIAIRSRNPWHALFVIGSLLYPWLAVFGDGYYEFEKHMLPVLFLGFSFSLSLVSMALSVPRRQSARILLHPHHARNAQENIA